MGLEIGFSLYEKNKKGKLVYSKTNENEELYFTCGRYDATNAFGVYFSETFKETTRPTFVKELNGYQLTWTTPSGEEMKGDKLVFVPFNEFKNGILESIDSIEKDLLKVKKTYKGFLKTINEKIENLRLLQKSCTEEQKFAFIMWQKEIESLEEEKSEYAHSIENFEEEDDDYRKCQDVRKILEQMEKYQNEGKYIVLPYYSY